MPQAPDHLDSHLPPPRSQRLRRRVREILDVARPSDTASRIIDLILVALIALSVLSITLESVSVLAYHFSAAFLYFEAFTVGAFSIEYVLRVWSIVENPRFARPVTGRIRYACSFMALVDLLAILPFYLPMVGLDLRFLRAIRLLRMTRMLKFGRYSQALQILGQVVSRKKEELVSMLGVMLILVLLSSSLLYYCENGAQPDKFGSIPAAMWWSICTLTTVGYGDVFPVTVLGRLLASFIAILGIGMFALPAGIMSSGMVEAMSERKAKSEASHLCPHCGRRHD